MKNKFYNSKAFKISPISDQGYKSRDKGVYPIRNKKPIRATKDGALIPQTLLK